MGSEADGVSDKFKSLYIVLLSQHPRRESLNVGVAYSVILSEVRRQVGCVDNWLVLIYLFLC